MEVINSSSNSIISGSGSSNNNYDNFGQINSIRDSIETMSKFNQIEILRILSNHKEVTINENKYGIHINLSDLNETILNELLAYIKYVNTQEVELNNIEQQKQTYKNIYFEKDNKDNMTNNNNTNKYVNGKQ
jgi:hypothetical protein